MEKSFRRFILAYGCVLAAALPLASAAADYQPARFADPGRGQRIAALFPDIDKLYSDYAAENHVPGLVWGVVLDGWLVHTGATGFANLEQKIPATADTRFRIASMTKSFTALAVLKLRDEGKLSLQDPVEKFIPDFASAGRLTADAPRVTLQHLLTMTAGFPEDNPWGDRQLAVTPEHLRAFVRNGVAWSTTPGLGYEYSNLGFALLGEVVTRVSGLPYQRYITREILEPLGMKDTRWEFSEVPADRLALGYRWENNAWRLEPMLHDGAYGAMGGLLTTLADFARYVSFHLAAWPPRDDEDSGPVRRATRREMQQPAVISTLAGDAKSWSGEPLPSVVGYGYGLRWSLDARKVVRVGHSGGLPGFGSNYTFFPDHGFAVIAFGNRTYAGTPNVAASGLLLDKGHLPARTLPVSATLEVRKNQLVKLINTWDPALADSLVAENFFLDRSREDWRKLAAETLARAGKITSVGPLVPQNQLRGTFSLTGEHGRIEVFFTLTPEAAAKLQALQLTFAEGK
jgi:CubicO group peptidase (beta-lactamase class C family)